MAVAGDDGAEGNGATTTGARKSARIKAGKGGLIDRCEGERHRAVEVGDAAGYQAESVKRVACREIGCWKGRAC